MITTTKDIVTHKALRLLCCRGWWIAESTVTGLVGDGATREAAYLSLLESMELQIEETVKSGNLQNLVMPKTVDVPLEEGATV